MIIMKLESLLGLTKNVVSRKLAIGGTFHKHISYKIRCILKILYCSDSLAYITVNDLLDHLAIPT